MSTAAELPRAEPRLAHLGWVLVVLTGGAATLLAGLVAGVLLTVYGPSVLAGPVAGFICSMALLGGPIVALVVWVKLLRVIAQRRRVVLRRRGRTVAATILDTDTDLAINPRGTNMWLVRLTAAFRHPDTGVRCTVQRRYGFWEFDTPAMRACVDRYHPGTAVDVLVGRGRTVVLDIPLRPRWYQLW